MANDPKAIQTTQPQDMQVSSEHAPDHPEWMYRPSVDILETSDDFVVTADLPGAERGRIDVTYQDDILSIQAPVQRRHSDTAQFYRQEYGVGAFHRRFVVEAAVNAEKMSAEYAGGVLTVRLPKAEQAKGRRIEVTSA